MAKGSESKKLLIAQLKEVFPDLIVVSDKEWRIPFCENGERVELKLGLTCAKDNIGDEVPERGAGHFFTDEKTPSKLTPINQTEEQNSTEEFNINVTKEEKADIQEMLARLNL